MKISIIISTYNGEQDIVDLMSSIQALELGSHEMEVIIRDDNSSDTTVECIRQNWPWVRLMPGSETLGFVGSNNLAVRHAAGDVICCLNQDTILDPRFLVEGILLLETYHDVVGVSTNMIMPWQLPLNSFKRSLNRRTLPTYTYRLSRFGYAEYVRVEPWASETNFLSGGAFFLKRSALINDENLFDPNLRMYCEDSELSLRLKKRGGRLLYAPAAILYHNQIPKKIGSLAGLKKMCRINWNRFYVLAKHLPPEKFAAGFPLYLWGIVKKMDHLGLAPRKRLLAACLATGLIVPFSILFPYWISISAGITKSSRWG